MYCTRCGAPLTPPGKFCNRCGHPTAQTLRPTSVPQQSSTGKRFLKWGGIGCGVLVGLFIIAVIASSGKGENIASTTPSTPMGVSTQSTVPLPTVVRVPTSIPQPTPISITSERLVSDKSVNKVAWTRKYVGNSAMISGEVVLIEETRRAFDVKLDGDFWTIVVCKINKSPSTEAQVLQLAAGDKIVVLGKITDDGIINIDVRDCSIIPQ